MAQGKSGIPTIAIFNWGHLHIWFTGLATTATHFLESVLYAVRYTEKKIFGSSEPAAIAFLKTQAWTCGAFACNNYCWKRRLPVMAKAT